ncbi:unnamed protein product [Sphagnum balticum]
MTYQERGLKQQLEVLCNLYALLNLHKTHSGDFLAIGYLTSIQGFHAKDQHNTLFSCVRPNAVALVDAFNHTDDYFSSALGCSSSTATAGSTAPTTPASVESFTISSHMLVFNSCEQWPFSRGFVVRNSGGWKVMLAPTMYLQLQLAVQQYHQHEQLQQQQDQIHVQAQAQVQAQVLVMARVQARVQAQAASAQVYTPMQQH